MGGRVHSHSGSLPNGQSANLDANGNCKACPQGHLTDNKVDCYLTQAPTPMPTPDPTPAPPPPPTPAPGLLGYLTTAGTSCCGTLQTSATETAMCRCTDGSRSVSVCADNTRCGNPQYQGIN